MGRLSAIRAATVVSLTGAFATGAAQASAASVYRDGDRWREVVTIDSNICGWPSTFTSRGSYHLVDMTNKTGRVNFTVNETNHWTLVISDDPSVPEAFRGEVWRGREVETDRFTYDPETGQLVYIYRVNEAEGPFQNAFRGRDTYVVDGSGILRVERSVSIEDIDCESLQG